MKILFTSLLIIFTQQIYASTEPSEPILGRRGYIKTSIHNNKIEAITNHSINGRLVNCKFDFEVEMLVEDEGSHYEKKDMFSIKIKGLHHGHKNRTFFAKNLAKKYKKDSISIESVMIINSQCSLLKKDFYQWCIDFKTPNELSSDASNTFSDILELFDEYKKNNATSDIRYCKNASKLHKDSLKNICLRNRGHWFCSDQKFYNKSKKSYAIFPYFWNAIHSSKIEVVKKLINLGADINQTDGEESRTPLFHSVFNWTNELTEELLELGANVNHLNSYGQNALFDAAEAGNIKMVETLISYGANQNIIDSFGHKFFYYNYFLNKKYGPQ